MRWATWAGQASGGGCENIIEDACGGSSPPPETHASSGRIFLDCVRLALCEVSTFYVTFLGFILSCLAHNSEDRQCAGVMLWHRRSTGCRLPDNGLPVPCRVHQFQNVWIVSCRLLVSRCIKINGQRNLTSVGSGLETSRL